MTSNKTRIVAALVGVVATTALVAGASSASNLNQRNDQELLKNDKSDREYRLKINSVIENGDYDAWLELVGDRPIADIVAEDDFSLFVEAHNLMKSGDMEGAKEIFDELGLEKPKRFLKGKAKGHRGSVIGMGAPMIALEDREAIRATVEADDYVAYKEAISVIADKLNDISEKDFDELVERHEQRPQMPSR